MADPVPEPRRKAEDERWILRHMNAALALLVVAFIGCLVTAALDGGHPATLLAFVVIGVVYAVLIVGTTVAHIGARVEKLERERRG